MITLFASIAGFITSIIPEIIKFFRDKEDKKHELEILDRQMKFASIEKPHYLQEIYSHESYNHKLELYPTNSIGITWVDALNGSVRPVLAYSFFLMYALIKIIQYKTLIYDQGLVEHMDLVWNIDDQAIFAGIISFYFGQREFNKRKK